MNKSFLDPIKKQLKSYNIEELYKKGIIKERILKNFSSQIVVTYPPLSILPKINPLEIFNKPNNKNFTLYIHIPFCTGKCIYCGFATYPNSKKDEVDGYLEALKKEMLLYLEKPQIKNAKIKSVYLGGGTPTYLSKEQLLDLLRFINQKFKIENDAECTIEASPETIDRDKLKVLLDNKINRISIGIQTFNNKILKLINRRHTSKQARDSFRLARELGFKNINIDLMRGLPDMNFDKVMKDLEIIKKLKPESVTSYDLLIKPNTAIQIMYSKEPKRFLDETNRLLVHLAIIEKLKEMGYEQNPIDWFYIKSKVYQQQIQKWEEIINALSFGVSAYSYVNNFQYYNIRDIDKYVYFINNGKIPVEFGEELSKIEQLNRAFVFGLKTKIDLLKINKDFGEIPPEIMMKINKLKNLGLIEKNNNQIRLTKKGDLFANEICIQFYSKEVLNRLNLQ